MRFADTLSIFLLDFNYCIMDDTTVDEWINFFRDAGIPPNVSASYASNFCQNRIHLNMVLDLNRDLLKELGVTLVGDAIAILRYAKVFHEQNVRQKILNSISSENQKPPEFSKKLISATDVASVPTNSGRFNGGISSRVAPSMENGHFGSNVTSENGNRQELLRIRQSQLTPKRYSLQRYGISTGRSVAASPSQMDNTAQRNISIGALQREDLRLCETPIPSLGEADTTEDMNVPGSASRGQNNLRTSCSENFLMRGPVESSSTLPLRQSAVPSCVSGGNYMCRRNQGLKRPTQQSHYTSISQTSMERLLNEMPCTPTACQSPIPVTESNILQDAPDEIRPTLSKRKKTVSCYRAHEQERFDTQSVATRVARRSESTIETINLDEPQVQEFSQLNVCLPRQDMKTEVTATEDPIENYPNFDPHCQLPSQRRQEVSPVQLCTQLQSQGRMQISQPLLDISPKSQILSESLLPSHVASSSQLSLQRMPQSHLHCRLALNLDNESQSFLPQPSVQPQLSVSSQVNKQHNQLLQNRKVMMQCNPTRSSSTAKMILAGGKKIKKFKLLHSRSRKESSTSQSQLLQSSECPSGNEAQRPTSTFAILRCSNKSVLKENENREKEKHSQTVLESGNAACVSQNESQRESTGAGNDFSEEEQIMTDVNTERSAVRWDTHQFSKPASHMSDSYLYDESSSHPINSSDGFIMSPCEHTANNLGLERVPGQVFSRLGVKVEFVSLDNDVSNKGTKNDALPISRFGSNVKYKINTSKKHKNLPNKFAKTMAVKQLSKNKFLKRKIVFKAFQKVSAVDRQKMVSDQLPQEAGAIDERQPKLRGILKPQTITSEQQDDMDPQEEAQSQKMTANLLLESVTKSSSTDAGAVSDAVEENTLSNDSTKSEEADNIYQNADNFYSDDDKQEQLVTASTSGICKTVRFGPVCVKEFQQNVPPSSGKTAVNFRPPIFSRLGAWRKGI